MPSSDKDQVRLLISDTGGDAGTDFIFHDDEIEAFISLEPHLYRAAGLALRTLAANEALVQKRIEYLDLSTDGAAVAKELRELASSLEERADVADDDDVLPEFANMGDSPFTRRDQFLGISASEDA